METPSASDKMISINVLYDMHTDFFKRAIAGITASDAVNRLNTKANHITWLAGSLVHERYDLVKQLGKQIDNETAYDLFKDHQGIKDDAVYPSLEVYLSDWEKVSPLLKNIYETISNKQLDESFEMMPGQRMTWYELISFMTYREANCIGQIALWRRLLGYEGISYM